MDENCATIEAIAQSGRLPNLRRGQSPNGAFNVTEFGTVADAERFRGLYAYSPYHRVEAGQHHPSMLLIADADDVRADPAARHVSPGAGLRHGDKRPTGPEHRRIGLPVPRVRDGPGW